MPLRLVLPALVLALLIGCGWRPGPLLHSGAPVVSAPSSVWLDQGWDQDAADFFTHGGFGASFAPVDWFLALEDGAGRPFAGRESMARFGFLVDGPTAANPDGLPLGFGVTKDPDTGEPSVGMNCAGCHLAELRYGGAVMRVLGGTGLTRVMPMHIEVRDQLVATAASADRLERMAAALGDRRGQPVDGAALAAEIRAWADGVARSLEINGHGVPAGPGRIDAAGAVLNQLLEVGLGIEGASAPLVAPISVPAMWTSNRLNATFVGGQTGTKADLITGVMVAQVLGTFPSIEVDDPRFARSGYPSSVEIEALGRLQQRVRQLEHPRWPTGLLPAIDADAAARGAQTYAAQCASCHPVLAHGDLETTVEVSLVPLDDIGTDRAAAFQFAVRRTKTGLLEGRRIGFFRGRPIGPEESAFALMEHVIGGVMFRAGPTALQAVDRSRTPGVADPPKPETTSYMARPLTAIWATPPYLHNGSVPSLWDLLLPPEQRPVRFHLGDGAYDPERVGFAQEEGPGRWAFDTTVDGNRNGGHRYGIDLADGARRDLVEYLKTL